MLEIKNFGILPIFPKSKASCITKAELQNVIDIAKSTIAKDERIKYKYR